MTRSLLLLAILGVSAPAWATGERVLLAKDNPLRAALCTSMECVQGGPRDAVVSVRPAKGGVEFVVTSASGQVRLVHKASLNASGQVGSTDLASAGAAVIAAIERGAPQAAPRAPAPPKAALRKLPRGKLVARR